MKCLSLVYIFQIGVYNIKNGQIAIDITEYDKSCLVKYEKGSVKAYIYGQQDNIQTSLYIQKAFENMLIKLNEGNGRYILV